MSKVVFYIFTSAYEEKAALTPLLHRLCHRLNGAQIPSYLVPDPCKFAADSRWPYFARFAQRAVVCELLNTPLLTAEVSVQHLDQGVQPICLLTESWRGRVRGGRQLIVTESRSSNSKELQLTVSSPDSKSSTSFEINDESMNHFAESVQNMASREHEPLRLPYQLRLVLVDFDAVADDLKERMYPIPSRRELFINDIKRFLIRWVLPPGIKNFIKPDREGPE